MDMTASIASDKNTEPDKPVLDAEDDENDWCSGENIVTKWDGEVCSSCGRVWGA